MRDHSPTTERMKMVKPKRGKVEADHRGLGKCGKPAAFCVGRWLIETPRILRKGDKLCPECSKAHTALLRRNEVTYWQWKEY